ncbi:KTSC domain-containing protein [Klebsiella oxytoca]|uniref:KTSC domain-containing protein n=1 Tax=Klebsiella oxytoca TaxID=571 RepID=UPI001F34E879|nr:KTSC domain-containing protein [Klebsiella oxytoca]EKW3298749.1 KTSC domain-containing protein [Klebsiella oxytoca]MCE5368747.1 KTSC domain-containing protein [Klebsiella oxytoca]
MHFQTVISSKIKSIGYYSSEKVLEVVFVDSVTYQYIKVSEKTHNAFLMAKSKGRFFEGVIKGKYLCRKTR